MTRLDTNRRNTEGRERRWMPILIVAAAAIVLGLAIVLTTQGNDEAVTATQPTVQSTVVGTTPTTVGTRDAAAETAAISVVEEAYETYNAGDVATWADIRDRGSFYSSNQEREELTNLVLAVNEAEMAADGRYEVLSCQSDGFGEWPEVVDDGAETPTGYRVTCESIYTDSFRGAAGLEKQESYEWVVADDEVLAVISDGGSTAWDVFTDNFARWMERTHPEVSSEIDYIAWQNAFKDLPDAASMPMALEYVDEYAATLEK